MLLDDLPAAPADPILGLAAAYERDPAPNKVDLGIGIYRDESGHSQVLASVKQAERWLIEQQRTKSYLSAAGQPAFNAAIQALLFGDPGATRVHSRVRTVQTPGGSGALRVAAEFIRRCRADAVVWLPNPTWANHAPILRAAGVAIREYRYYEAASHSLSFEAMLADLEALCPGDVVLVHACCHNPSGADLGPDQWRQLADVFASRSAVPLIDIAYQGFADSIEQDAQAIRLLCEHVPEMMVVSSCSKNFALYRERTGALSVVGARALEADRAHGHVLQVVRTLYSMPPDHGAAVVAQILGSSVLRAIWSEELTAMRERIKAMRLRLADLLGRGTGGDFSYLTRQYGMFSFLDVSSPEVARLRDEYHIHLIASGRINVAALSTANVASVAYAVAAVLRERNRKDERPHIKSSGA